MKRAVCIAVLAVLLAVRAHAYTLLVDEDDGSFVRRSWPAGAQPVAVLINDQTGPQLPNVTPDSDPLAAVEGALGRWPAVSSFGLQQGTTAVESAGDDDLNIISFVNTAANRQAFEMSGNPVGLTLIFSQGANIVEADVIFNPSVQFTTTLDTDEELDMANLQDIEAVAVHELGHLIGLHHTGVQSASMWPLSSVLQRSLDADDIAGARTLYPVGGGGTIQGTVTVDGLPAFGAHVVALGSNGTVAASALTLPDGTYAIESLTADTYTVYVEPLDGPHSSVPDLPCIRVGNISGGGIYNGATLTIDFPTTFFGGNDAPAELVLGTAGVGDVQLALSAGTNSVNPTLIGPASVNGGVSLSVGTAPLALVPGEEQVIAVAGPAVDAVPAAGLEFSDARISVELVVFPQPLSISCGGADLPIILLRATVAADAAPGARTLFLTLGSEVSAFTGAVDVAGAASPCVGDCNGDGQVTVDELLTMVNVALGNTLVTQCEAGDVNGNGQITVDEILTAVNNVLSGCPAV